VSLSEIDVDELATLGDDIQLIDVREVAEHDEVRIAGVRLVPLQQVPDALDTLDSERPVYVICRSGGRSLSAATFLAERGFDAVNVTGGMLAWIAAGQPVDEGREAS
jgi:rhodanese-related sulfurtransferase